MVISNKFNSPFRRMEKRMDTTRMGYYFNSSYSIIPKIENQTDKKMDNAMNTVVM